MQLAYLLTLSVSNMLVSQLPLLWVIHEAVGKFFVFQQDYVPARDTVLLVRQVMPTFIPPDLWPLNSPDLNTDTGVNCPATNLSVVGA